MALIVDTGPILAALDAEDPEHTRCARLLTEAVEMLVVVAPTLVEIDYWVRKRLSPAVWRTFIEDIVAGAYRLVELNVEDLTRVEELERTYASLRLGFVDAAVISVCERLRETKVATLDQRHFGVVRPRHCAAFQLLPD